MTDQSDYTPHARAIDGIADSFVRRLRAGQHPSVDEYVQRYPDHAAEIRDLLPTLVALEDLQPGKDDSLTGRVLGSFKIADQFGEYRILREIGRGGMGIVFEAEHCTMRRRVALKVLPTGRLADEAAVKRFHREARAAGQLHHTNIVPVFEVGEAAGVYYYAMQYIHGQNLDVVIDELRRYQVQANASTIVEHSSKLSDLNRSVAHTLRSGVRSRSEPSPANGETNLHRESESSNPAPNVPPPERFGVSEAQPGGSSRWTSIGDEKQTYFQRVAQVGQQVAEALNYAHRHGVLHRDIKPSNLLLDTEGVVWITDFGLAKDEGDDLTHTGDVVGTLRYMAPERFRGAADTRSDIYSLGLTLYELCTLQYAFDQPDRAQLVKQVTTHQPTPPRRIQPQTPRDLETIILKAIERDPSQRYQSCRQFALDLERFIADRPISARRISVRERCWRWCRRNPIFSSLLTCILLLLVIVACGSLRFAYVTNTHLKALERAGRGGRAHLYFNYKDRGVAQRSSRRQGQNLDSRRALVSAVEILPTLGLSPEIVRRRRGELRSEFAAASALLDLEEELAWPVQAEWSPIVAFDADFQRVAQADKQGNIAVRSLEDDSLHALLPSPGETCWFIRFSPDGRFLAARHHPGLSPDEASVSLWDLKTNSQVLHVYQGQAGYVRFTPDSKQLSLSCATHEISFYRTSDGEPTRTMELDNSPLMWEFNNSGTQMALVATESKSVDFWVLEDTVAKQHSLEAPEPITEMEWNEQRQLLALACANRNIYVWDLSDPSAAETVLTGHEGRITRMVLRREGDLLLSSGWDGKTRMFDVKAGREVLQVDGLSLAGEQFGPDDRRIGFTSNREKFGVWRVITDRPTTTLHLIDDHQARIAQMVFYPLHHQLILYPSDQGLHVWNFGNKTLDTLEGLGSLQHIDISPDGKTLYTCGEQGVVRWKLEAGEAEGQVKLSALEPETLSSSPADRFVVHDQLGILAIRERSDFVKLIQLDRPDTFKELNHVRLNGITISHCGRYVFTSTWQGHGVYAWSVADGHLVKKLLPEVSTCRVATHPDGKRLTVATGFARYTIDIESMTVVSEKERANPDGWAGSVQFSHSGQLLACPISRYRPQLIDTQTGETLITFESASPGTVDALQFSQDDRYLAIAEVTQITVWDLANLRQRLRSVDLNWDSADGPSAEGKSVAPR